MMHKWREEAISCSAIMSISTSACPPNGTSNPPKKPASPLIMPIAYHPTNPKLSVSDLSVQQKNRLMKPLGNLKGCIHLKDCRTKTSTSLPPFFGQNYSQDPQYAPESLRIDPQLQICHEIISKAVVFEKNRTAKIPVSGVEQYGVVLHGCGLWLYC